MPALLANGWLQDERTAIVAGSVLIGIVIVAVWLRMRRDAGAEDAARAREPQRVPPDAAGRAVEDEPILVEVVNAADPAEAEELAARLRAADVAAIAKAEPAGFTWRGVALYRFAVVVPAVEAARAADVLAALHPREGDATDEEIERILRGEAGGETEPEEPRTGRR